MPTSEQLQEMVDRVLSTSSPPPIRISPGLITDAPSGVWSSIGAGNVISTEPKYKCSECEAAIAYSYEAYLHNDVYYCNKCFHKSFTSCGWCGGTVPIDDICTIGDRKLCE